jgi:hypothetical protein
MVLNIIDPSFNFGSFIQQGYLINMVKPTGLPFFKIYIESGMIYKDLANIGCNVNKINAQNDYKHAQNDTHPFCV